MKLLNAAQVCEKRTGDVGRGLGSLMAEQLNAEMSRALTEFDVTLSSKTLQVNMFRSLIKGDGIY